MRRAQKIIKAHNEDFYSRIYSSMKPHEWIPLLHELQEMANREEHIAILNAIIYGEPSALITHIERIPEFVRYYPILIKSMIEVSPQKTIVPVLIISSSFLDRIEPSSLNEFSLAFIQDEKTARALYSYYGPSVKPTKRKILTWIKENRSGLIYWSLQHNRLWIDEGLILGTYEEKEKIVEILLPYASFKSRQKALEIATEYRKEDVIKVLISDPHIIPSRKDFSIICSMGLHDCVKILLPYVNPSSEDLYLAASNGHSLTVRLLLADEIVDPREERIVSDTVRYGHTETLRILLKDGRIMLNSSLLEIAAENGHTEILRLLLSYDLEVSPIPILKATKNNFIDCVRILLPYGYGKECYEKASLLNKKNIMAIFEDE